MATLSNAEIQKRAMEDLQATSENDAITIAKTIIRDIAYQQSIIEEANKRIAILKEHLGNVSIKDYSVLVKQR